MLFIFFVLLTEISRFQKIFVQHPLQRGDSSPGEGATCYHTQGQADKAELEGSVTKDKAAPGSPAPAQRARLALRTGWMCHQHIPAPILPAGLPVGSCRASPTDAWFGSSFSEQRGCRFSLREGDSALLGAPCRGAASANCGHFKNQTALRKDNHITDAGLHPACSSVTWLL